METSELDMPINFFIEFIELETFSSEKVVPFNCFFICCVIIQRPCIKNLRKHLLCMEIVTKFKNHKIFTDMMKNVTRPY